MTTRKQNTTILAAIEGHSAREQLAALKAEITGKKVLAQAKPNEPIDMAKVPAVILDTADRVGTAVTTTVKEHLVGDNNFFLRVNLERMKLKKARGGYAK